MRGAERLLSLVSRGFGENGDVVTVVGVDEKVVFFVDQAGGRRSGPSQHLRIRSCHDVSMGHGVEPDLAFVSAETARSVAETMQALATPSRVRILSRLAAGPCSVGDLASDVTMEQSAVSQQLRVLRHLGLVVGERDGRHVIYALHDDHVRALLTEAVSHTEHLRLGLAARPADQALHA